MDLGLKRMELGHMQKARGVVGGYTGFSSQGPHSLIPWAAAACQAQDRERHIRELQ